MWPVRPFAPSAEKSINLFIEHQCPQCGAPAVLSETDRLFQCQFCKVRSYLEPFDYYRYVLPHNAPKGRDLIYFPYWRFKGMIFSCLATGIQNRFLDASRQALHSSFFPASVGLRSQAMKLRFVTPETRGRFLRPTLPFGDVRSTFMDRFNRTVCNPILHQAHIGESLSLLYAPFYADKKLIDGVLNKPVSAELDAEAEMARLAGGPADWRMGFIPTLCPHCGWDMQGDRDALVLFCKNCCSMWQVRRRRWSKVNVAHLPAAPGSDSVYLPFWRIRAEVSGISLNSYADLVKLANLPKVVQPDWHRLPHHFWSPAFKVRPQRFLRLASQITLCQPREHLTARVPAGPLHTVNLPLSEARELLKMSLTGFVRPKKIVADRIADIQVKAKRFLLVYLPFEARHHDLVQAAFNVAINRNQLALAGNL